MAYEKKQWVSGETPLSADNMNNIENGIKDLENQLNSLFTTTQETFGYTISAGQDLRVSASDLTIQPPEGYSRIIGIYAFSSGNGNVLIRAINPIGTDTVMILKSISTASSPIEATCSVTFLWSKV